jgi:hypothetical protein
VKNLKHLVKTKTFWSGVGLIVYGLINKDAEAVLTGLSVIFLREALERINHNEGSIGSNGGKINHGGACE